VSLENVSKEQMDKSGFSDNELRQKLFVICDNCYWAASALSIRPYDIDKCPVCKDMVSSLPLENNEVYKYNFTPSRGVELEFSSIS
jgi:hypothetical protein